MTEPSSKKDYKNYYIYGIRYENKANDKDKIAVIIKVAECRIYDNKLSFIPEDKKIHLEKNNFGTESYIYRLWKTIVSLNEKFLDGRCSAAELSYENLISTDDLIGKENLLKKNKSILKKIFEKMGVQLFKRSNTCIFSDDVIVKTEPLREAVSADELLNNKLLTNLIKQKICRMKPASENAAGSKKVWEPESNISIDNNNCIGAIYNFLLNSSKNKEKCKLIIGEGGIGKSNFMGLIKLSALANPLCGMVYSLNLPHMFLYSISHPVRSSQAEHNDAAESGGYVNGSYTTYLAQYLKLDTMPDSKCLFILDGLNELEDMITNANSSVAENIFTEIREICKCDLYQVIISTRLYDTAEKRLSGIDFSVYSPQPLDIDISNDVFPEDTTDSEKERMSAMLRLPLFYLMYRELPDIDDGKTKRKDTGRTEFELMLKFFMASYKQSAADKDGQDNFLKRSLYFFLMPLIAHKMHIRRKFVFTYGELSELIEELNNGKSTFINKWVNYCAEEAGIEGELPQVETINNVKAIIKALKNSNIIISENAEKYKTDGENKKPDELSDIRFSHQVWLDFLGAYYVLNYLKIQKTSYNNMENITGAMISDTLMPVFNLPSRVQNYISKQTNIFRHINPQKNETDAEKKDREKKNEEYGKAFEELFEIGTLDKNLKARQIEYIMTRLYTAYEMYDFFMLHHYDAMEKLAGKFCYGIVIPHKNQMLDLNESISLNYCKSLSALMECERRNKNYEKVEEIYNLAMDSFDIKKYRSSMNGAKMITYRLLRHQYAKAKLFESRMTIESGDRKKGKEQFKDAIDQLKMNTEFNLSANLLGCIYASPNSFIVKNTDRRQDLKEAIKTYHSAFTAMTSESLIPLTGIELLYVGRQYVNLMMKGYVRCKKNNDDMTGSGVKEWIVNSEPCLPDTDTLRQTKYILDHLSGQEYPFLNWDRAMYYLYTAFEPELSDERKAELIKEAARLFITEKDNIMTMTVRLLDIPGSKDWKKEMYIGDTGAEAEKLERTLMEKIDEHIGNIGKTSAFDLTDSYYYLQDLNQLIDTLELLCDNHKDIKVKTEAIGRIKEKISEIRSF